MFCINCGEKLPENAKFCLNCGTRVALANSDQNRIPNEDAELPGKTFDIARGQSIHFNHSLCEHIEIQATFERNATDCFNKFESYIVNKISSFEQLYGEAFDTFLKIFNTQMDVALDILISHGFDLYSLKMLKEKVWTHFEAENSYGWKELQKYNKYKEDLESRILKIKEQRHMERSSRSYWSGGGFGIKGALIGSVEASMLNLGAGAFRGLSDAIVDSFDKREINDYMNSIYSEGEASFCLMEALYQCICDIGEYVFSILLNENLVKPAPFTQPELVEAKAANIHNSFKKGNYSATEAIGKLCECVPLQPFDYDPLARIYVLAPDAKANLLKLQDYLGYKPLLDDAIARIDTGTSVFLE